MISVVADTQSIVWFLGDHGRLSRDALDALRRAESSGGDIIVSTIGVIELIYAIERGRLPAELLDDLRRRCESPAGTFRLAPADNAVTIALARIPRDQVPDMPDRIIGATAVALDVQLVTSDKELRDSVVPTIW